MTPDDARDDIPPHPDYLITCLCCGYQVLLTQCSDDCCPVCYEHCDYDGCNVLRQPDTKKEAA